MPPPKCPMTNLRPGKTLQHAAGHDAGRGHGQIDFPSQNAGQIVVHQQPIALRDHGRMDEDGHVESADLFVERIELLRVQGQPPELGGGGDAVEPQLADGPVELRQRGRTAQKRRLGQSDEASGETALELCQTVVDVDVVLERRVPAQQARQHRHVHPRVVHVPELHLRVVEPRMHGQPRHARIQLGEQRLFRVEAVLLGEIPGDVVMLKIDDHETLAMLEKADRRFAPSRRSMRSGPTERANSPCPATRPGRRRTTRWAAHGPGPSSCTPRRSPRRRRRTGCRRRCCSCSR